MKGLIYGVSAFLLFLVFNQLMNQMPQILTTYFVFKPNEETIATITSASIKRGTIRRSRTRLAIEYSYVVDGICYHNDLVRFKTPGFEVQQTIDRYPMGSKHVVHFNRSFPGFSVLEKTALAGRVWLLLGSCVLIGWIVGIFKRYKLI